MIFSFLKNIYSKVFYVFVIFLVSCFTFFVFSCKKSENKVIQVTKTNIESIDYVESELVYGTIIPKVSCELATEVEGVISSISADVGKYFRKGQTLATLKNIAIETNYENSKTSLIQAEANLEVARNNLKKKSLSIDSLLLNIEKRELEIEQLEKEYLKTNNDYKDSLELLKIGGISEEQINSLDIQNRANLTRLNLAKKDLEKLKIGFRNEDILFFGYSIPTNEDEKKNIFIKINTLDEQSALKNAEANVLKVKKDLEVAKQYKNKLFIKTPFDCVVSNKNFNIGEFVSVGTKVFSIYDWRNFYAVFNTTEKVVNEIKLGQKIELTIKDKNYPAVVETISPQIDTVSGTKQIKASLKYSKDISIGNFFKCSIPISEKRKIRVVEKSAVKDLGNSSCSLFLIKDNCVFEKRFESGVTTDEYIEIINPPSSEIDIVLDNSQTIKEGDKVEIL